MQNQSWKQRWEILSKEVTILLYFYIWSSHEELSPRVCLGPTVNSFHNSKPNGKPTWFPLWDDFSVVILDQHEAAFLSSLGAQSFAAALAWTWELNEPQRSPVQPHPFRNKEAEIERKQLFWGHLAATPFLHHLHHLHYPGSGDSDLESDFPVQKDFLSVGRGVERGIVLPSSGSSGNKNLRSNKTCNYGITPPERLKE